MTTDRFSLYDFFVDIIPGAIAILLSVSLLSGEYDIVRTVSQASFLSGTTFLILSYVFGHLIQGVVSPVDNWFVKREPWFAKSAGLPHPFEYRLKQADGKDSSVDSKVNNGLGSFFNKNLSGYEQFFITQSYLWNNNIGRMRRFQRLYTLFRGLYPLFLVGGLLHWLLLVLVEFGGYQSVWSQTDVGIIGFSLVLLAGVTYWRRVRFHKEMAKAMIFDFYANVLSQED